MPPRVVVINHLFVGVGTHEGCPEKIRQHGVEVHARESKCATHDSSCDEEHSGPRPRVVEPLLIHRQRLWE